VGSWGFSRSDAEAQRRGEKKDVIGKKNTEKSFLTEPRSQLRVEKKSDALAAHSGKRKVKK
jgi:hypothetical protein